HVPGPSARRLRAHCDQQARPCRCLVRVASPPSSTVFPYTTLFRSRNFRAAGALELREKLEHHRFHAIRAEDIHRGNPFPFLLVEIGRHTSELQSLAYLVCRLLLGNKERTRPSASRTP